MNLQAVGTGPFIFEALQSGSQLSVKKNPNYWDKGLDGQALPYLDKIVYRFVPDDSVRLQRATLRQRRHRRADPRARRPGRAGRLEPRTTSRTRGTATATASSSTP